MTGARPHVVRLAAAVLVTAAAGLAVSAPAQAASCPGAHGVTVVVDFHQLGGGAQSACDAGGTGKTAATQLTDVGHQLTYVARQPGFVCRVDGAPASDPCVNTPPSDAYWSLWWSDGKSGKWTYSSSGAGSLQVPDGGYVALSWQGPGGKAAPRVTPAAHASPSQSPSPTPSPTRRPSPRPTHASAQASAQASVQASVPSARSSEAAPVPAPTSAATSASPRSPSRPRAAASQHLGVHPTTRPPVTTQPQPTDVPAGAQAAASPHRSASASADTGLPGWVAPVLVGALFVAAAAVAVVRRKRAGGA